MELRTNRQKQAAETKRKIYTCAKELFSIMPLETIKVQEICKKADVSVGTFYHYFQDKESVLNDGYRLFDLTIEEAWKDYTPASYQEAIYFLINQQAKSILNMGHIAATNFFKNQMTIKEKYIFNKDRFFYTTLLSQLQIGVEQKELMGSVEEIAELILQTTRGVIYNWCLHDASFDLLSASDTALRMVLLFFSYKS